MYAKKVKVLASILAVIAILGAGLWLLGPATPVQASAPVERGGPGGRGGQGGNGSWGQPAISPLSEAEKEALARAVLEEYGALNLYQAAAQQFDDTTPFARIALSEQQHVSALIRQAEKYGVTLPENPGLSSVPTFASLTEACRAGVAAEIADAQLYDQLSEVTTHSDILRVYANLKNASLYNHLPAFQTCD